MTRTEAKARLAAFARHETIPCDECGTKAGAVIELGDADQGNAYCPEHFRRWLDNRYAAMGMPVTAAEKAGRAARGVSV